MTKALHRTLLVIMGVLLVVMLVLLFHGPTFTARGLTHYGGVEGEPPIPDLQVHCGAVVTVGWPTDNANVNTHTTTWTSTSYQLPDDLRISAADDRALKTGLTQECNERRDTYLGLLIVLAVASCLLGSVTIARRRTHPDPATTGSKSEQ
ncbi:MAG: hypothetical protein ACRDQA_00230 [Nocardioidaceae bacterium]